MKVQILLSTYNGEQYLGAQLESLFNQDYPALELLIRDDGSRDNTLKLAEQLCAARDNVRIIRGSNLGVVQSFFKLLELSSSEAGYLAFCDQDDVWLKHKISRAVACLNGLPAETPRLYCTRLAIVDNNLKPLGYSQLPQRALSFQNALVEGMTWGCTVVINRAARELLLRQLPDHAYLHDWWFYLVISAFGEIHYDVEPAILYRRHQQNTSPFQTDALTNLLIMLKRFHNQGRLQLVLKQAEELDRIFGTMLKAEHKRILSEFLASRGALKTRLNYALADNLYRQSRRDTFIMKCLSVIKRL